MLYKMKIETWEFMCERAAESDEEAIAQLRAVGLEPQIGQEGETVLSNPFVENTWSPYTPGTKVIRSTRTGELRALMNLDEYEPA